MSLLEPAAVVVTLAAVYLTARERIWCWPVALVSVTLYALVFYRARLYADMGLQGVYFAMSAYGWWAWLHGGEERGRLEVTTASWRTRSGLLVLAAVTGAVLGTTLARLTDASLPYLDSTLTSYSLVGQWLMARKVIDTWVVWIAVDVVYVGMFVFKKLYLTSALYAVFLGLAAMGFIQWRRSMAKAGLVGEAAA